MICLTGNQLSCDCRLSWVQMLRNETKSEPLIQALDDVTCAMKTIKTNEIISIDNKNIQGDEFQKDGEQILTKEAIIMEPTEIDQVVLVNLPVDTLPCPSELNGEDSLMLSSKDENYWRSPSGATIVSSFGLLLTIVLAFIV